METITIAGGTGLVGQHIISKFKDQYKFKILTRSPKEDTNQIKYYAWDLNEMTIDPESLDTDYLINLTGAGIADQRWTNDRKKILIDSRVNSNRLLVDAVRSSKYQVKSFTSASAIGYYGDRGAETLTENSIVGQGFLAECCELWEKSALELKPFVDHFSIVRVGLVLSTCDGALPKMLMTKNAGFLSYFGNGGQYYSWIHIDDLANIFIASLTNPNLKNVINGVAPAPLTNKAMMKSIKKGMASNAIILPAPKFGLRLMLGEMADVVLNSTRVMPQALIKEEFNFEFGDPGLAVKDLIERSI